MRHPAFFAMNKTDLSQQFKSYYTAALTPQLLSLPAARYVAIEGKGDPSGPAFVHNLQPLYAVAYAVKFACKEMDKDFVVPKLEAQWWFDMDKYGNATLDNTPQTVPRCGWQYRLLLRMPGYVTCDMIARAAHYTATKKKMPGALAIHGFEIPAGDFVQLLHVGPFANEPVSLSLLAAFIKENQLRHNGHHHEVYLSDFRKTAPEKLKTILREPVRKI